MMAHQSSLHRFKYCHSMKRSRFPADLVITVEVLKGLCMFGREVGAKRSQMVYEFCPIV